MFWIICDPSTGSIELYFTEIIRSGSQTFVVCLVGVWQHNFEPVVCVCVRVCMVQWPILPCAHTHNTHTTGISLNFYNVHYSSPSKTYGGIYTFMENYTLTLICCKRVINRTVFCEFIESIDFDLLQKSDK